MKTINVCPSNLSEGHDSYSRQALNILFSGQNVSPYLNFSIEKDKQGTLSRHTNNLSISGAQEKYGAVIENGTIRLAEEGEQSTHILKPPPQNQALFDRKAIPANEHLTMQIATQVYGIKVAPNGLCLSKDKLWIYITKRFDIDEHGRKYAVEDFAAITGRTADTDGDNFKYEGAYEDIAIKIKQLIPAWKVALEKFFSLIIFNYIFANGDAHLKNFSILKKDGEVLLSPAYDLINTEMHIDDADFALKNGLSTHIEKSEQYEYYGHPCKIDFIEFGKQIGLNDKRIQRIINAYMEFPPMVNNLIANSFLTQEKQKRNYKRIIEQRRLRFIR